MVVDANNVVAAAPGFAHGIAVDATDAYFAGYSGGLGAVMKAPVSGGAPSMIASDGFEPTWVVVDATDVYWADSRYIQRATLDGARTEQLLDEQWNATALAIDDAFVYWGGDVPFAAETGVAADG